MEKTPHQAAIGGSFFTNAIEVWKLAGNLLIRYPYGPYMANIRLIEFGSDYEWEKQR